MIDALAARIRSALNVPAFVHAKPATVQHCVLLRATASPVDPELSAIYRTDLSVQAFSDDIADALDLAEQASEAITVLETPSGPYHWLYVRPATLPVPIEQPGGAWVARFMATARWRKTT